MKQILILKNGKKRVRTLNEETSMTDPSFQRDCDVNEIVKKFQKTGQVSHLAKQKGVYADVSEIQDLQGALNTVRLANESFMTLPSKIREKFHNDPQHFITFLQDPKNDLEAYKLGLKSYPTSSENTDGPNAKPSAVKAEPPQKKTKTKEDSHDQGNS